MTFSDDFMVSQNKMAMLSMGTLFREPLEEVVVLYNNIYKIKKRAEVRHTI